MIFRSGPALGLLMTAAFIGSPPEPPRLDEDNLREFFALPVEAIVQSYRRALGKGIRSTCPMQPSCSTYGLEAVKSHGGLVGLFHIVDRLNRCGHDTYLYPIVQVKDRLLFHDPVGAE